MKKVFIGSLVLAILHSVLFFGQKLGASVTLYTVSIIFFIINTLEENEKIKNKKPLILSVPIILLSMTYFIFNSPFFYFWNIVVMIILFAIMMVLSIFEETKMNKIIYQFFCMLGKPFEKIDKVIDIIIYQVFDSEKYNVNQKDNNIRKRIILGVVVSVPILAVILLLLSSADSIFAKGIEGVTSAIGQMFKHITIPELLLRVGLIIIMTVYVMSVIYHLMDNKEEKEDEEDQRPKIKFDNIIANTVLTILNIIYIIFCYIQIVNLFMGYTDLPQTEYADYARKGFFQLMAVSIINLIIILITIHNHEETSISQQNYTKIMNLLLAIFTFIILMSSFMRMYLYEQAFGYTFLRLMVYVILITEAILMIPTIMHIFNKDISLVKPYFIIIVTMYVIINYINIDNMIAKKNIDKYLSEINQEERSIDFKYLKTTGIDGTMQIKRLLNVDDENLIQDVKKYLQGKYNETEKMNIPEFNINKYCVQKLYL